MPEPKIHESESLINKHLNRSDPILLENLAKNFGNVKAVHGLSVSIKMNEVFTILGHNGAGKTTAL